jgi:hypothetical protein
VRHPDAPVEATCARCGDFLCRLCAPLEPVSLCPRCVARGTVDWEERGDLGPGRAFLSTARESLSGPLRLGAKLNGAGHAGSALQYAFLCGICGLFPLSLLAAAPLLSWADAQRLGLESTGSLGAAVAVVLGALIASTLLASCVGVVVTWLWCAAVLSGVDVRLDVLLRAAAYGMSPLAIPILGPIASPLACLWAALSVFGALCARSKAWRALLVLSCAVLVPAFVALALWFLG